MLFVEALFTVSAHTPGINRPSLFLLHHQEIATKFKDFCRWKAKILFRFDVIHAKQGHSMIFSVLYHPAILNMLLERAQFILSCAKDI